MNDSVKINVAEFAATLGKGSLRNNVRVRDFLERLKVKPKSEVTPLRKPIRKPKKSTSKKMTLKKVATGRVRTRSPSQKVR